jgi:hypothetical protein
VLLWLVVGCSYNGIGKVPCGSWKCTPPNLNHSSTS